MEKHQVVKDFSVSSAQSTVGYNLMQIYNMERMPCYFDMASKQTFISMATKMLMALTQAIENRALL